MHALALPNVAAPLRMAAAAARRGAQPVGPHQSGETEAADAQHFAAVEAVTQANAATKNGKHGGIPYRGAGLLDTIGTRRGANGKRKSAQLPVRRFAGM